MSDARRDPSHGRRRPTRRRSRKCASNAWRTTYPGMIPAAYLAAMKVEDSAALWQRILGAAPNTTSVFVADDRRPTWSALPRACCCPKPKLGFDSELTAIYLRARCSARRAWDAASSARSSRRATRARRDRPFDLGHRRQQGGAHVLRSAGRASSSRAALHVGRPRPDRGRIRISRSCRARRGVRGARHRH